MAKVDHHDAQFLDSPGLDLNAPHVHVVGRGGGHAEYVARKQRKPPHQAEASSREKQQRLVSGVLALGNGAQVGYAGRVDVEGTKLIIAQLGVGVAQGLLLVCPLRLGVA